MTSLVNPYFKKSVTTEQDLMNGLIKESIQVVGRTYYYMPRNMLEEDLILGEDVLSKFQTAIEIEMYMSDNTGFQGQKEMFSKFGFQLQNSFTLVVSQERWETELKTFFDGDPDNGEASYVIADYIRPREGDLVYDPLTTILYEVKFVDHDVEFFTLGKNYMYHLSCEAFQYSNEQIETGVTDIDDFSKLLSRDVLFDQVLCENGDSLTQEDCEEYILLDVLSTKTTKDRDYGTDFESDANDIIFTVRNPFGDL